MTLGKAKENKKSKEMCIVFSFSNFEFNEEKDYQIYNKILDPIRERFPILANTRLYKNNSNLLLNYRVDKSLNLKRKYNDFKPEFRDLISEISVIEENFDELQRLNGLRPKKMNLREFHEILYLFNKKENLKLIRDEKDLIKKRENIAIFISSEKMDINNIKDLLRFIPFDNYVLRNNVYKELAEKSVNRYETIQDWHYEIFDKKIKKEDRKNVIMAYDILKKYDILSPKEYNDAIFLYLNGRWKEEPIIVLDKIIIEYMEKREWLEYNKKTKKEEFKKQQIRADTINLITRFILRKTQCSIKDFDIYDNFINVNNGIIDYSDINNLKTIKHSRLFRMCYQSPVKYDKKAKCPKIEKFLNEILEEKYFDLIYEFLGDSLTGKIKYQKALLFTGEGANGKSTLIELFRKLVGFENCSGTSLQKLLEDKFGVCNLEGKLLNLSPDIPKKALVHTEIFKQVVGDHTLTGEKKFRNEYEFYNHSKHIFSCNAVPRSYDTTHAFYRRWIIIPFLRIFAEEEQEDQDKLIKKLSTQSELSGLLNKVLKGLENLINRGFYKKEYYSDTESQWELFSKPLLPFIEDYLKITYYRGINKEFEIDKNLFLNVVNLFLKKHNQPQIKATNSLTRKINEMKEYNQIIGTRSYNVGGERMHVYTHISFNERAIKEFKTDVKLEELENSIEDSNLDIFTKVKN